MNCPLCTDSDAEICNETVCEECKHEYHTRLNAEGMPACERCVLSAAVGM